MTISESGLRPCDIGELVLMIQEGVITGKTAKSVADEMMASPGLSPRTIVDKNPSLRPFQDTQLLEKIVSEVVEANPQSVKDFLAGRDRAFSFLVGQVMKRTQGSAQPEQVNSLLKESIARRT